MKSRSEEECEENNIALLSEQPSTSRSIESYSYFLIDKQIVLFVMKFKKLMGKKNFKNYYKKNQ